MSYGAYPPALPPKSKGLAFLLTLLGFVAIAGLQYFYIGKFWKGFFFLITGGWFFIGTIISCFTIMAATTEVNMQRAAGIR